MNDFVFLNLRISMWTERGQRCIATEGAAADREQPGVATSAKGMARDESLGKQTTFPLPAPWMGSTPCRIASCRMGQSRWFHLRGARRLAEHGLLASNGKVHEA